MITLRDTHSTPFTAFRNAEAVAVADATTVDACRIPDVNAIQVAGRLAVLLESTERLVGVAGLAGSDGSTRLAASLGRALALLSHAPVLLLDGNAAAPSLSRSVRVPSRPGLLEVLAGDVDIDAAVRNIDGDGDLRILPFGNAAHTRGSLLAAPAGARVLDALRERFRYVVVDVGAVFASPESLLIASCTHGLVAAVAAGERRRHEIADFARELQRLRIRLLGVVLTHGADRS